MRNRLWIPESHEFRLFIITFTVLIAAVGAGGAQCPASIPIGKNAPFKRREAPQRAVVGSHEAGGSKGTRGIKGKAGSIEI